VSQKTKQPNVLVLCTDQMQSYCLGCNGHPEVQTPNIDALAAQGVNFQRGYCNNSVCMPSRATMMTGLTPRQHGLLTNGCCLSEGVPTIGQALVEVGYRTHAVGKLHLQPFGGFRTESDFHSLEARAAWDSGTLDSLPLPYYGFQGVDFVGGHVNYVFGDYRRWLDREHPGAFQLYQRDRAYKALGEAHRMEVPAEIHYNQWIADRTAAFLQDAGASPFFLFCSFPDPHFPYAACRPYSEMYDPASLRLPAHWQDREDVAPFLRANREVGNWTRVLEERELREIMAQTYGMISHVDDCIGQVLAALAASGLANNTIVALIADHGEYLGAHNLLHKGYWPVEELVRIPFVMSVPGAAPRASAVETPVSLLDLVPTIADYAGLPAGWHSTRGCSARVPAGLPGRSLRAYFESPDPVASAPALLEYDEDFHPGAPLCRMRGIVDGDWKLARWGGFAEGVLFDLQSDPLELRNLWNDPRAQAEKCRLLDILSERLAATDRFDTRRISGA